MDKMDGTDLGQKQPIKAQKKGEYRDQRLRIGLTSAELTRYAEMAVEAGFRHSAQKLFKINKRTGEKAPISVKDIAKFVRDVVVPYYEKGKEDRKRIAAAAMQKKLEAEAELAKAGVKF